MDRQIISFELRRQSDDLIYIFDRALGPEGQTAFKRRDGEYWIIWHKDSRWIAGTWNDNDVLGRPWDQLTPQTEDCSPEGVWVSRKGFKSYVYELVYL